MYILMNKFGLEKMYLIYYIGNEEQFNIVVNLMILVINGGNLDIVCCRIMNKILLLLDFW